MRDGALSFAQGVSVSTVEIEEIPSKSPQLDRQSNERTSLCCESLTQPGARFAGLIWTRATFVLIYQMETTT
jgi:hypothetical protein